MFKKIIHFFLKYSFFRELYRKFLFKKKMKKINKKDPFVYWAEEEWDKDKINLPKIKNKK